MTVTLPPNLSQPSLRREDFRRASNYGFAAGSEMLRGPMRRVARRLAGGKAPTAPETWRNGLVIGPDHIGDVLYNTASLPALKAGLPECRWTCLASDPAAQALRGNPHLKEIISYDHQDKVAFLRSFDFDVAIAYAVGSSWSDLWLATRAGIPNRVGYVHKGFSGLVTHPVAIRFPQPFPAYFRDLVSQITGQPFGLHHSLQPLVDASPESDREADQALRQLGLDVTRQPVLACSVTSRQLSGIWPAEKYLETILQVRRQVPCTVLYLGSRADQACLTGLAARTGPESFALAGDLDLPAVVSLLRRCHAALTTDSGSRHLANAAGIPVVFPRNLSNRKIETGVYCETEIDVAPEHLELLNREEQAASFAQIDPAQVAAKVIDLLRRPRPVRP